MSSERTRTPTVYPVKRKRSHDRGLTLEERLVQHLMFYTWVEMHQMQHESQWLMASCPCVADGSGHWARSAAKVIREQYRHRRCSTGHRAQRLHGVRLPALPVRFLPMCTTRQPWTNHLPSLRNQERSPKERKKRLKSQLLLRSRYMAVPTKTAWWFSYPAAHRWKNHMSLIVDSA